MNLPEKITLEKIADLIRAGFNANEMYLDTANKIRNIFLVAFREYVESKRPKDSNISYHDAGNIRNMHQEARDSYRWEEEYNKALKEFEQSLLDGLSELGSTEEEK